jgi:hypothetical protein
MKGNRYIPCRLLNPLLCRCGHVPLYNAGTLCVPRILLCLSSSRRPTEVCTCVQVSVRCARVVQGRQYTRRAMSYANGQQQGHFQRCFMHAAPGQSVGRYRYLVRPSIARSTVEECSRPGETQGQPISALGADEHTTRVQGIRQSLTC